ncbi:MAG TPA: hypothetical protein VKE50_08055 [Thermoanaerobaculia bacterium]|nr:hypothetical protein [Thermoanaerobaculia bacterium]
MPSAVRVAVGVDGVAVWLRFGVRVGVVVGPDVEERVAVGVEGVAVAVLGGVAVADRGGVGVLDGDGRVVEVSVGVAECVGVGEVGVPVQTGTGAFEVRELIQGLVEAWAADRAAAAGRDRTTSAARRRKAPLPTLRRTCPRAGRRAFWRSMAPSSFGRLSVHGARWGRKGQCRVKFASIRPR